jgi:hypothetical protein
LDKVLNLIIDNQSYRLFSTYFHVVVIEFIGKDKEKYASIFDR